MNIAKLVVLLIAAGVLSAAHAQPDEGIPQAMSNARIGELLAKLDVEMRGENGRWQLVVDDRLVTIVTHEAANRMRIFTEVARADELDETTLRRILQANFDSALDARYAIAKGVLWSAFIHPLAALDDESFLLGLGQVVNLANTYGDSYSSGLLMFGGGDSRGIREREIIEQLIEKGLAI